MRNPPRSTPQETRHGRRPHDRRCRRDRCRHRRQQPRAPPHPARVDRRRADRQGRAAQPRWVDGPRVQLHLHRRPLARDHRPDARLGRAVPGDGRLHAVRRLRDRPHRGAHGGAAAPHVERQGLGDRVRARQPGLREGEGALHRGGPVHRRVLDARRGRGRLAARRHDHARAGPRHGRAHRRTHRRGHRPRHRGGAERPAPDHPGAHVAAATSRRRSSSSRPACGARSSATWRASASR